MKSTVQLDFDCCYMYMHMTAIADMGKIVSLPKYNEVSINLHNFLHCFSKYSD